MWTAPFTQGITRCDWRGKNSHIMSGTKRRLLGDDQISCTASIFREMVSNMSNPICQCMADTCSVAIQGKRATCLVILNHRQEHQNRFNKLQNSPMSLLCSFSNRSWRAELNSRMWKILRISAPWPLPKISPDVNASEPSLRRTALQRQRETLHSSLSLLLWGRV